MRASPWRHVLVLACAHALVLASIDTKPCRQARLNAKRMRLDDGKRTALTPGDARRQRGTPCEMISILNGTWRTRLDDDKRTRLDDDKRTALTMASARH
jgi:hypothetical protein